MRLIPLLAVALLASALPLALAHGTGPHATVALTILHHEAPSHRECRMHIVEGWTMWQLLDNATPSCLRSYEDHTNTDNVDCINGLCVRNGWQLYVNETFAEGPHNRYRAYANGTYEWVLFAVNVEVPPGVRETVVP